MNAQPDPEPVTLFLQIAHPDAQGFYRAEVMADGMDETRAWCGSPHLMGIIHWLSAELRLRIVDRLSPPGGSRGTVVPGLYVVEPVEGP